MRSSHRTIGVIGLATASLLGLANAQAAKPPQPIPPSTLYVDPAFPGVKGTSQIPAKGTNRAQTLGKYLGEPSEGKHPRIEWDSRYTQVWRRPPHWAGFQSGSFNNRAMAVSILGRCGHIIPPGGGGGGDWKDPIVFIGSGGGPFMQKEVARIKIGFVCDGKTHVLVRESDWADVDAAYRMQFRAPYVDVRFPVDEDDMMIMAEDDTWLHGIVSATSRPLAAQRPQFWTLAS